MRVQERLKCQNPSCNGENIIPIKVIRKGKRIINLARCPQCLKKYKMSILSSEEFVFMNLIKDTFFRCDRCRTPYTLSIAHSNPRSVVTAARDNMRLQHVFHCNTCRKNNVKVISKDLWTQYLERFVSSSRSFTNEEILKEDPDTLAKSLRDSMRSPLTEFDAEKALLDAEDDWELAIRAFDNEDFDEFMIKADSSVERFLKVRYYQTMDGLDRNTPFNQLIEEMRDKGFKLPTTEENSHWRNIRNEVARSEKELSRQEGEDGYEYFRAFLVGLNFMEE